MGERKTWETWKTWERGRRGRLGRRGREEDAGEKIWAGVLELESRFTKLIPDGDTPVIAAPSQILEQMIGKKI